MVGTGLNEVIATWKIMPMSLPRMPRYAEPVLGSLVRSTLLAVPVSGSSMFSRIAPSTSFAGGVGTMPRIDCADTDC